MSYPLLESVSGPEDLKQLDLDRLTDLASEIRHAICDQVSRTGGHLAPNLGVVELTIALHRVFRLQPTTGCCSTSATSATPTSC